MIYYYIPWLFTRFAIFISLQTTQEKTSQNIGTSEPFTSCSSW